jgi:hypothetical protein
VGLGEMLCFTLSENKRRKKNQSPGAFFAGEISQGKKLKKKILQNI